MAGPVKAKVTLGDVEVELSASISALVIYEQEFSTRDRHADLIKDVFGKQTVETGDGEDSLVVFDFGSVNWTDLTRAVWAMAKAADGSLPPFEKWAATVQGVNLYDVSNEVTEALIDGFFRPAAPAPAEG